MMNTFAVVAAGLTILLLAWKAVDWLEDRHSDARARLAQEVRTRQRMGAVVLMSERRKP